MENKLGMVGMGKVTNGVITFVDATGKGFSKSVSRPVVQETIEEEVIVEKTPEILDVPYFMKNRVKPEPMGQVYLFTKKEEPKEEEEQEHPVVEALFKGIGKARKIMVNNPVFKYFIDDYQQTKKGDK
jgi:hypothetical protein